MQYFGGKKAIAGHITSVIKRYRKPGQLYLEPFCGSDPAGWRCTASGKLIKT